MKYITSDVVYSEPERETMLAKMARVSDAFYMGAVQIGCHPFIEFTGLMNEYIKVCRAASKAGVDFTEANTHSGVALPMAWYEAGYLAEKLGCIFGPSLMQDEKVRSAFIHGLLDGHFELIPRRRPLPEPPVTFEDVARKYLGRLGNSVKGPWIDREWPILARLLAETLAEHMPADEGTAHDAGYKQATADWAERCAVAEAQRDEARTLLKALSDRLEHKGEGYAFRGRLSPKLVEQLQKATEGVPSPPQGTFAGPDSVRHPGEGEAR